MKDKIIIPEVENNSKIENANAKELNYNFFNIGEHFCNPGEGKDLNKMQNTKSMKSKGKHGCV